MYDGLTGRYTFSCPAEGEVRVRLSAFRELERLPGAAHPAVYQVSFACPCGSTHYGLIAHDELDWSPLGIVTARFFNLMTSRLELIGDELAQEAAQRIRMGEWPWTFFCYPEDSPRPVFPSAFRVLAPANDELCLVVRCPSCQRTSVNLVSNEHVDVPFYSDRQVVVVEHIFEEDRASTLESFRMELYSAAFERRRRNLAA